jgi:hypothetical protein
MTWAEKVKRPRGFPCAGPSRSLWDVEDVEDVPPVREMILGPAPASEVREFAARYHYTGLGSNANWRWGLWHGAVLFGIVSYNLPTRSVCASVFGPAHLGNVWHMGRLAMADRAPANSESRLIGLSLQAIEREYPYVWAVLTYAATDAGHIGYIYQATNAIYTGPAGDPVYYLDQYGNRRGTHLDGHGVTAARAAELGWTRQQGGPKHRYVYVLGNRRQRRERLSLLRWSAMPYPKEEKK